MRCLLAAVLIAALSPAGRASDASEMKKEVKQPPVHKPEPPPPDDAPPAVYPSAPPGARVPGMVYPGDAHQGGMGSFPTPGGGGVTTPEAPGGGRSIQPTLNLETEGDLGGVYSGQGNIIKEAGYKRGTVEDLEGGRDHAAERESAEPVGMDSLQVNFQTVVEAYLAKASDGGFWSLKDPKTGRILKLEMQGLDRDSLDIAGAGLYRGIAAFLEAGTQRRRRVEFVVDMSGFEWHVKEFKLVEAPRRRRAAPDPGPLQRGYEEVVRRHVQDAAKAGGAFHIQDDVLRKTWSLELVAIHSDRLFSVADGRLVACADLQDLAGAAYVDLDFFVTKEPGGLSLDNVMIHRVNGKPRFIYNVKREVVPLPKP